MGLTPCDLTGVARQQPGVDISPCDGVNDITTFSDVVECVNDVMVIPGLGLRSLKSLYKNKKGVGSIPSFGQLLADCPVSSDTKVCQWVCRESPDQIHTSRHAECASGGGDVCEGSRGTRTGC